MGKRKYSTKDHRHQHTSKKKTQKSKSKRWSQAKGLVGALAVAGTLIGAIFEYPHFKLPLNSHVSTVRPPGAPTDLHVTYTDDSPTPNASDPVVTVDSKKSKQRLTPNRFSVSMNETVTTNDTVTANESTHREAPATLTASAQ